MMTDSEVPGSAEVPEPAEVPESAEVPEWHLEEVRRRIALDAADPSRRIPIDEAMDRLRRRK